MKAHVMCAACGTDSATTTGGPVMSACWWSLLVGPMRLRWRRPPPVGAGRALAGRLGAGAAALGFLGAVVLAFGTAGAVRRRRPSVRPITRSCRRRRTGSRWCCSCWCYGVSAIVQTFAIRYLAEDRPGGLVQCRCRAAHRRLGHPDDGRHSGGPRWWAGPASGLALCLLLATYWRLPSARDGVRRTAAAFLIGDLALWSAVGVGRGDSGHRRPHGAADRAARRPDRRPGRLPGGGGRAVAVGPDPVPSLAARHPGRPHAGLGAAARRGGQRRRHPADQAQPAGDRGRSGPGADHRRGYRHASTYGAVVMLVKPDVKGALAHSTMAQMGFMILTCGLGLWAAAVFHLVAHGFYKATLFLSSGSAIAYRRRSRAMPPPHRGPGRAIPALLLPAGRHRLRAHRGPDGSRRSHRRAQRRADSQHGWKLVEFLHCVRIAPG